MSKELKPCPFCGETSLIIEDHENVQDVHVLCKDCGARISFEGIRYTVASRWNTRPVEHALQKRIEELEAENRRLRSALRDIEDFAHNEYWKTIPAPICVKLRTIDQYAEKVLKGDGK